MCATPGCNFSPAGKSKYCKAHKAQVHQAWLTMVKGQAVVRDALHAEFAALVKQADDAGQTALAAIVPTPMIVFQCANMLDDNSPVVDQHFVEGGVCGFAWVHAGPANTKFTNWAKECLSMLLGAVSVSPSYGGGININVRIGGQSMARKEAYANAFAHVLKAGLANLDPRTRTIYASSRMD